MARVIVTEAAKQDVRDILTDLSERAGYAVASRYGENFKAAYRGLASFLAAARRVQHLPPTPASRSSIPT